SSEHLLVAALNGFPALAGPLEAPADGGKTRQECLLIGRLQHQLPHGPLKPRFLGQDEVQIPDDLPEEANLLVQEPVDVLLDRAGSNQVDDPDIAGLS